jgi:hypothetical protein
MPTVVGNLTSLGVDLPVARTIQLIVAVVVAGTIWACFRFGTTNLGMAALLVGTFLATPYAFFYDMPVLTNAVLATMQNNGRTHRPLPLLQTVILVLSLILPALMVETWRLAAFRIIPLILLFGLIVWRIAASEHGGRQFGTHSAYRQSWRSPRRNWFKG